MNMRTLILTLLFCSFLLSPVSAQDSLNVSLTGSLYNYWDNIRDLKAFGRFIYVANGGSGLRILDASDPENPFETSYIKTGALTQSVEINFPYGYISIYGPEYYLDIIDVSDPYSLSVVSQIETGDYCHQMIYQEGLPNEFVK